MQTIIYNIIFNNLLLKKTNPSILLSQLQLNKNTILSKNISQYTKNYKIQYNKLIQITNLLIKKFQQSNIPKLNSITIKYYIQKTYQIINKTNINLNKK